MDLRHFPILADENIGLEVIGFLRESGFEVESILENQAFGWSDLKILNQSHSNGQVILTQDSDFGTLIFRDAVEFVGIVYLRPGHFSDTFHISTLKTLMTGGLELNPPFILVAENTGETVKVRLRNLQ